MGMVIPIKGSREAPKASRSSMETIIVSLSEVESWQVPPFQRPVRVNEKVRQVAEDLKKTEAVTGILTLGRVGKNSDFYIVDGQHRIEAFKISGLKEIIADVRICHFDTMSEMAEEFVRLNSALVRMRPDDVLRGLEPSVKTLQMIRHRCEFVGYDNIRRGGKSSPILSMSAVLRCWNASSGEIPTTGGGASAALLAENIDATSCEDLIRFLITAHAAWGRDPENFRLWGNLNLAISMWLWRRLVLDRDRGIKRYAVLNVAQFKQCLMSVSANKDYWDWLPGRTLGDRDRSPAYDRIKKSFVRRLYEEKAANTKLPSPAWASN